MHRRLALVLLSLAVGCGGESVTTVTGSITFNDKPVTTGLINFMVDGGRPLGGAISPEGTYSFELPPGDYKVRIDSPPPMAPGSVEGQAPAPVRPGKPPEGQVPAKFASFGTSGLTLSVGTDSPQQHDFKLP